MGTYLPFPMQAANGRFQRDRTFRHAARERHDELAQGTHGGAYRHRPWSDERTCRAPLLHQSQTE